MTDPNYIIVQAGGLGSRLGSLTKNKPKALVSVDNLPIIFHLFGLFPDKHFIIIGDYKIDVLQRYLAVFADVSYEVVDASGEKGTSAGLDKALGLLPDGEKFVLTWSDLLLPEDLKLPADDRNYIGLSCDFRCRWRYQDGDIEEVPSTSHGIAGFFVFKEKSLLRDVPNGGEFVRWLSTAGIPFEIFRLTGARECGTLDFYDSLSIPKWRPFNTLDFSEDRITKIPISEQGERLAIDERAWYQAAQDYGMKSIPKIYSLDPLVLERISGVNIYECGDLPFEEKKAILDKIVSSLREFHEVRSSSVDIDSYRAAYIDKTFDRIDRVRALIPHAESESIVINGKTCKNVFFHKKEVSDLVMEYIPSSFVFIHGDCTFSNMMVRDNGDPVFLDPRGYFGSTKLLGDPAYDWVKVFYSLYSNYDQFNLKNFSLEINENEVFIKVDSNGWEELADYYLTLLDTEIGRRQMFLFLAITWLSLTTYAWNDYDSICGAFYLGLLYLQEAL